MIAPSFRILPSLLGALALSLTAPISAQFRAVNLKGPLINTSKPDLVVSDLRLTPSGEVQYTVANVGPTGSKNPFVVDVYINDTLLETVKHDVLAGGGKHTKIASRSFFSSGAGGTVTVKVDPQFIVAEWNENNNSRVLLVAKPPLPDLITIGAKFRKINGRQVVVLRVVNNGTAPTRGRCMVRTAGYRRFNWWTQKMSQSVDAVPSLAPGQSIEIVTGCSFKVSSITTQLDVWVDSAAEIAESRENNNHGEFEI